MPRKRSHAQEIFQKIPWLPWDICTKVRGTTLPQGALQGVPPAPPVDVGVVVVMGLWCVPPPPVDVGVGVAMGLYLGYLGSNVFHLARLPA